MTHCEKCIYYDKCKADMDVAPDDILSFFPYNEDCKHFKNKADFVEVKHGEWCNLKWMDTNQHCCSLCSSTVRVHPQSVEYKYCPYCGAKMDISKMEISTEGSKEVQSDGGIQ